MNIIGNLGSDLLLSIALIIILAAIMAYLAKFLKQPLIPAYILTGIILGPLVLGLIKDTAVIRVLSEIGIAFLLFIVGLEMDLKKLKEVGFFASVVAFIQVMLTFSFGFLIAIKLGFAQVESIYIGLILAFSSTMVVVKLLSDKEKLDTLHGRIILAILLVQDILVVFALAFLPSLGGLINTIPVSILCDALLKGLLLFLVAIVSNKFIFGPFFGFAAKSQELLFLCSITVCFLFILLASSLGFSIAVGAFIAGIGLATLPYSFDIIGQVRPLKDFFATIFFVSLGMEIVMFNFNLIKPLLWFLGIVVIFKPAMIMIVTSFFGYEKRTSFLSSISLAQISEFSLIIAAQGLLLGVISQEIFSMTVLMAIITIALTSYLIQYEEFIYFKCSNFLSFFERLAVGEQKLGHVTKKPMKDIVLFGCHRMGSILLKIFKKLDKGVLVVDDNPEIIKELMNENTSCIYGDAANLEVLERLKLEKTKIVVSTIPNEEINLFLVGRIKEINPKIIVFVTADHLHQGLRLYDAGADYVILPHVLSGEIISNLLSKVVKAKRGDLKKLKERHLKHILSLELYGYKKH